MQNYENRIWKECIPQRHDIAHAENRRLLAADGSLSGRSFSPRTLGLPCQYHSTNVPLENRMYLYWTGTMDPLAVGTSRYSVEAHRKNNSNHNNNNSNNKLPTTERSILENFGLF
jgi:hypothetical protein